MSDSRRSERIRDLFEAVVGLGPEERAVRIAEACGEDAELRREVESLLEAADARGSGVRRALEGLQPAEESSEKGSAPSGPGEIPSALQSALATRYRIEREIGRGGMAKVYLADDLKLPRQVAIKVMNPDLSEALGADRFLREIETASSLAHPHILKLHDSGEAEDLLYYVMPYVEGESLRARLKREKQLPVEDAVRIAREVADALAYAHDRDLIHRDVKPANILLEAGHAVLADFGVAKAVAEVDGTQLTQGGTSLGTPAYMSPEQMSGEQKLDGRSDQYALGCVLYEMLAGQPPHQGPSLPAIVAKMMAGPAPSVRTLRSDVPEAVERALAVALERKPEDRHATVAEFGRALTAKGATPVRRGTQRRSKVWRAAWAGLAVLMLGAAGWWASMTFAPGPDGSSLDGRPSTARSIAVLPFDNLSPVPDSADWFAQAVREEVSKRLNLGGLTVRHPTTVATVYGAGDRSHSEIASELRVDVLLETSIQVIGDRFRLSPSLIDVESGTVVWQGTYQGDYTTGSEIFETQTEVAQRVASALGAEPTAEELTLIGRRPTENLRAWSLYQRGRFEETKTTRESLRQAVELYEQAIEEDPEFGQAYAGVASAYTQLAQVERWTPDAYASRVTAAAERALEIDSTLAEPYRILADVKWLSTWDFYGAERDFEKALSLDANSPMAHMIYAQFLNLAGRHQEALEHSLRAQEVGPGDPWITANVGFRYYLLRRYDEAMEGFREALELDPNHWVALWGRGFTLSQMGRYDEAIEDFERALELAGGGLDVLPALGVAYAQAGRPADAERVLGQLVEMAATEHVPPTWLVQLYAGLGETDVAFQWLDQAYQERDWLLSLWMPFLADSLGADPRYQLMQQRMGLSDYFADRDTLDRAWGAHE